MKATKSWRQLRWPIRIILGLILLLILLFAASNLFLASSLGQKFLQKNLTRRTNGLQWQVSGANWSPWRGITIKELSAHLDTPHNTPNSKLPPLLTLQEINLKPYWGQLIRGKKLFREIVLEKPNIQIPIEHFIYTPPTKPKHSPSSSTTTEQPKNPKKNPPPKKKKNNPPKKPLSPPPKKKTKPQPTPPDEKRFWLRLRQAKINFYSLKLGKNLQLEGLDLDLPLAGPDTKGKITWQQTTLAGQPITSQTTLPVEWTYPAWKLPIQKLTLNLPQFFDPDLPSIPLTLNLAGKFGVRSKAREFRITASIPSQPITNYIIHQPSRFHLKSPAFTLNFSAQGLLNQPDRWRIDSSYSLNQLELYSELRSQHLLFDTARARVLLRNSTLIAPTLSLRSERLSLLGNGQLHLGGYLIGVIRIITDPEFSSQLTSIAIGSGINRGWNSNWLQPLQTPDRYYRDLQFEGFLPNAQVNAGRNAQNLPLTQVINLLRNFTTLETNEELETIKQSP